MKRRVALALFFVLVFASIGSAQVSIEPNAQVGFLNLSVVDDQGDTYLTTNHTALQIGGDIDFGNALRAKATFQMSNGGNMTEGGVEQALNSNSATSFRLLGLYAFDLDGFTVGPAVEYQTSSWTTNDGTGDDTWWTSSVGIGAFGETAFDQVIISATYIHRLNVNFKGSFDGTAYAEDSNTGSFLSIDAAMPLSGAFTLVGGYEMDRRFADDSGTYVVSGFRIGASYAF